MLPARANDDRRPRDALHLEYRHSLQQQPPAGTRGAAREPAPIRRLTSDESWIEVASQPSSSSISSAAPDEIITTGLRVAHNQSVNPRRRRRLHRTATDTSTSGRNSSALSNSMSAASDYSSSENGSSPVATSSSGDEYRNHPRFAIGDVPYEGSDSASLEEEDDDDDNEGMQEDDDDSDENATALGLADPSPIFTPQPNAFSHPPSTRLPNNSGSAATTAQDSYFPPLSTPSTRNSSSTAPTSVNDACHSGRPATTPSSQRPQARTRTRSHTPYTALAPSHSVPVDHDAALRASLSTLLSCAAAARGLSKRDSATPEASSSRAQTQRVEPAALRLVSEADLQASCHSGNSQQVRPTGAQTGIGGLCARRRSSSRSSSSGKAHPQYVRKAKSPARKLGAGRRRAIEAAPVQGHGQQTISPTLMTWVLGAGVMVLFSALSFSAGYALGREVGRVEAQAGGAVGAMGGGIVDDGWFGGSGLRSKVWRWGNGSGIRA